MTSRRRVAAIGVDIGGTSVKLGLVDEAGKVLFRREFPTKRAGHRRQVLETLVRRIREMAALAKKKGIALEGVGVGAPGPIDVERGRVYFFPNIRGWRNTPLKQWLERRLGLPVRLDNDANAMAYGEYRFGAGRGSKNIIALTLGTGIGGGIILDGKLFHGPGYSAAEIGHLIIHENGPRCACGNRGCVEAYVGNGYFVREIKKRLRSGQKSVLNEWWRKKRLEITPRLVDRAARARDAFALRMWRETGEHLGTALAGLVNILNPEKIILGGGVAQSRALLFPSVRHAIRRKAFSVAARSVRVVPAGLGVDAGLIGAAALALEPLQ